MNYSIANIFLLLLLWGCSPSNKTNPNSIMVDIDKKDNISIFDLFEKIEIIPLETGDQSTLLHFIDKLICWNDILYIHDYNKKKIMAFDSSGKFLFVIDNRGQGPNEYQHIADFTIDKYKNRLIILDPIRNNLLEYDLTGKFLDKIKLPAIECSYDHLNVLNNDKIAFWTFDTNNRLKVYDKSDNHIFQEYFPQKERSLLDHFTLDAFPYSNYLVTESAIDNNIYEISANGTYSIAYTWDFGKLNNSAEIAKNLPEQNFKTWEEINVLSNRMLSSEIVNYYFTKIGGNQIYRYAKIARKGKMVNIWHKISEKKTYVFDKTIENTIFHPLYWDDTYVIGFGPYAGLLLEETIPDVILDKENLLKKRQIKEEDNPVLLKYYFKK